MHFARCSAAALSLCAAGVLAGAAHADGKREPYFTLGVGYTAPDDSRAAAYGLGGSIGYARSITDGLWAEGRIFANVLEADAAGVDAFSQQGIGLDALIPFGPTDGAQLFLLAGGGAVYNDVTPDALDGGGGYVNAGAGWRSAPVTPGGLRYRLELRAIHDRFDRGQVDVLLGFLVEFAGDVAPAATPAPVSPPARTVQIERTVPPVPPPTIPDTDGDGIPDESDRCAQTLSGAKVESDGCVWGEQVVTMNNIRFEPGSAHVTPDSRAKLDSVTDFFRNQPDVSMDVVGHTDAQGAEAYNLRLSTERAASVRAYLIGKGIAAARLKSEGRGESQPIDDNSTAEGRTRNRRVELHIHARQPR